MGYFTSLYMPEKEVLIIQWSIYKVAPNINKI